MSLNRFFAGLSVSFVKGCRWVPMFMREGLSALLGSLCWLALARRRRITLTNLRLCMPELSEKERAALGRSLFRRIARSLLDHGRLWSDSAEGTRDFVTVEGIEHLVDRKSGEAVIVVSPHFVGLDAAGIMLNTYVRGVSLYQTQSIPEWDKAFFDGRKRFSDPVLIAKSGNNDLRTVMKSMKEGLPFYYLPDMDHGEKNSLFLPFFGVNAATLPMVSRLARVTRAKVLWCIATMTDRGYHVIISEPWRDFPTKDPEADTRRLNRELEDWIRAYPDQYYWVHRRFKTRPEGEPSVYED